MPTFITPAVTIKKISFKKVYLSQSSRKKTKKHETESRREQHLSMSYFSTLLVFLSIDVTILKIPKECMIKSFEGEVATGHPIGNIVLAYHTKYKS